MKVNQEILDDITIRQGELNPPKIFNVRDEICPQFHSSVIPDPVDLVRKPYLIPFFVPDDFPTDLYIETHIRFASYQHRLLQVRKSDPYTARGRLRAYIDTEGEVKMVFRLLQWSEYTNLSPWYLEVRKILGECPREIYTLRYTKIVENLHRDYDEDNIEILIHSLRRVRVIQVIVTNFEKILLFDISRKEKSESCVVSPYSDCECE